MDKLNSIINRIYRNPALLWRAVAALVFITLAVLVYLVPSFSDGMDSQMRNIFCGLMLVYGLYRLYTFYNTWNKNNLEE